MKRLVAFLLAVIFTFSFLFFEDALFGKILGKNYFSSFGAIGKNDQRNQGLALQKTAIHRNNSLMIYGSSELNTTNFDSNPANFFDKKGIFEVTLVGGGFCQSLIQAINLGGLNNELSGKKIVIILSPQWFAPSGLSSDGMKMNFSELQFYSYMLNANIDEDTKTKVASRVLQLLPNDSKYEMVNYFCKLQTSQTYKSKGLLLALKPYFWFKYKLLSLKDDYYSLKELQKLAPASGTTIPANPSPIYWGQEKKQAELVARKESSNNIFGIENKYYNTYIDGKLENFKGNSKDLSFTNSPEYEDLQTLLQTCKELNIKPLVVSVPVNGLWYDYCGVSRTEMQNYYEKVNQVVSSYGFEVADFSTYQQEKYFLKDSMHLGWKGWVYVDEAIYNYFKSDK